MAEIRASPHFSDRQVLPRAARGEAVDMIATAKTASAEGKGIPKTPLTDVRGSVDSENCDRKAATRRRRRWSVLQNRDRKGAAPTSCC